MIGPYCPLVSAVGISVSLAVNRAASANGSCVSDWAPGAPVPMYSATPSFFLYAPEREFVQLNATSVVEIKVSDSECFFLFKSTLRVPVGFMETSVGAASAQVHLLNLPSESGDFSLNDTSHCEIRTVAFGASPERNSAVAELPSRSVTGSVTFALARKLTCGLTSVPDTLVVPEYAPNLPDCACTRPGLTACAASATAIRRVRKDFPGELIVLGR